MNYNTKEELQAGFESFLSNKGIAFAEEEKQSLSEMVNWFWENMPTGVDGADIRNKLGPFKDLIRMIDSGTIRLNGKFTPILEAVNQCRASLDYLSNLPGKSEWVKCAERLP